MTCPRWRPHKALLVSVCSASLTEVEAGALLLLEEFAKGSGVDVSPSADQQLDVGQAPPLNGDVQGGVACRTYGQNTASERWVPCALDPLDLDLSDRL